MLLYLFTVRYSTVLFYTILRFPGQSFTAVRTRIIETTTFIKTPHTSSFEKWYPPYSYKKQRKFVQYLMGNEQVPLKEVVFCDTLNVTFLIYFPVFHCSLLYDSSISWSILLLEPTK